MSNHDFLRVQPITLPPSKQVYFASDFHLGAPSYPESRAREERIVRWLSEIQPDAHMIFLLGDLFDFWFEYRHVVPKGYIRLLGKLAALVDQGIQLVFFTGNHDMWMFDYFEQELGVPIIRQPISIHINNYSFHIGHGDGLGNGDGIYKLLKKVFQSRLGQRLFSALHPDWGIALANRWSRNSRRKNERKDESFRGKEHEWIYQYCQEVERRQHHDYYIFGHRHLPLDIPLNESSRYVNTGEWLLSHSYVRFDGQQLILESFKA